MSVELQLSLALPDAHKRAIDELNRWRGHCIEAFARLEEAATQTIDCHPLPAGMKRPSVFGERIRVLKALLAEQSDKRAHGLKADLDKMEDDLAWRNRIVHAAGSVYIDRKGTWLWAYRFQPSKAGAPLDRGMLDQKEGQAIETRLSSMVRSLTTRLEPLRTPQA
ncbi:hypothetical protein V6R86_02325 [Sphingomonas kaistensis]|uniref:Uncharacterized protein n=1 Tax=Sphingomonas kaistensis TaxID=298708 RepID=A0ABZ2G0P5_9SPHN